MLRPRAPHVQAVLGRSRPRAATRAPEAVGGVPPRCLAPAARAGWCRRAGLPPKAEDARLCPELVRLDRRARCVHARRAAPSPSRVRCDRARGSVLYPAGGTSRSRLATRTLAPVAANAPP